MIFIFFVMFPVAWAEDYLVKKHDCVQEGGILSEIVYKVPPEILLNCSHEQGVSQACGHHAVTALLTALYKSTCQSESADNLDVLDLIGQLGDSLNKPVNLMELVLRVKQRIQYLSEHRGLTVKEYVRLANQENVLINAVFQNQKLKKHQLPKFGINFWVHLHEPDNILEVFKYHFKSKNCSCQRPLLPLLCAIQSSSEALVSHATLVTGLVETTCRNGAIYNSVLLQDSADLGCGPYDLGRLVRGMTGCKARIIEFFPVAE